MRLSVQIAIDKIMDLETPKASVTIGRGTANDIIIPHDTVSRTHCRIEFQKGMFYITDLGSSNGTFIDGQKIAPEKRTAILTSSQLVIGKLDCELHETGAPLPADTKIISSELSSSGDYTSTMRISRLDLNRPSITLEQEKKQAEVARVKPKARNPVTEGIETSKKRKTVHKESRLVYIIVFIITACALWWLISGHIK